MLLATGILGATVMPHAVWLHSSLTAERFGGEAAGLRPRLLRAQRADVGVALGIAGIVNAAMLVVAAAALDGHAVTTLEEAYHALARVGGSAAGALFAVALLASGLAATSVGAHTGQVVLDGYLQRRIPLWLRRSVTLVPALLVVAAGVDATRALVASQVVLSFGLPSALVPLVVVTRRRDLMGPWVNRWVTTWLAVAATVAVITLNVGLVVTAFAG